MGHAGKLLLLLTLRLYLQYSLSPDPSSWGANISPNHAEPDDYLHNPDPRRDRKNDKGGNVFTPRGFANLGCLALLVAGIVTLLSVQIHTIAMDTDTF